MEGVLNMFQELWAGRRIKGGRLDRIKIRLILRRCADGRIEAVKVVKGESNEKIPTSFFDQINDIVIIWAYRRG